MKNRINIFQNLRAPFFQFSGESGFLTARVFHIHYLIALLSTGSYFDDIHDIL